jgi:hypothetical protein
VSVDLSATAFPILDGLRADGPFPAWRDELMLFGQFVGTWDMAVEYYDGAGHRTYQGHWEWSFAWILGGRAIQDVIVDLGTGQAPRRTPGGTTLRYFSRVTGRWTVYYLGAVAGVTVQLEGRDSADETIVLEGAEADGTLNRWTFSDIRPDSFTWTGLESRQGTEWWRNQRMLGTRRAGTSAS